MPHDASYPATDADSLELRILSGGQAYAKCIVRDGTTVGCDLDCDVILDETEVASQIVRISADVNAWRLEGSAQAADASFMAFNKPYLAQGVWITIAACSAPWPEPTIEATPATATPIADNHGSQPLGDITAADSNAATLRPAEHDATTPTRANIRTPPRPTSEQPRLRESWPVMLGIAAIILAVIAAIILSFTPTSTRSSGTTGDQRLAAAERSLGPIAAALERLGVASRLQATLSKDRIVTVSGWTRDAAEQDRVAEALSQIWPMPALRLSNEDETLRTAQDALDGYRIKFVPRYEGSGRLTIGGVATDAAQRDAALEAVRRKVPGMTILGGDILLAQDVARDLSKRLDVAGLARVSLTWQPTGLSVQGLGLNGIQTDQLSTLVAQFNSTHFGIVSLVKPAAAVEQVAATLPFKIRSVVGGMQPLVVLDDGTKVLVGGMYQGYQLTAIEDKRLIFDGPRRTIIMR